MDPYSSGEDLVIKTRKPYTITKQRERWTEEEHNRFLEALKLHGRAWQRIEEHIGTKTAVQIRSHAQKFFTKLEKEAVVKGVPIGHALDIDIPPPRPKRKPSNPYPRKTNVVGVKDGKLSNSVSSSCQSKLTGALEKDPEKPCDDGKLGNCNDYWEKDDPSEAFTLLKTAPCASPSSANRTSLSVNDAPGKSCTYRQYVPLSKEQSNQDETAASMVTIEAKVLEADKSGNKKLFQNNAPFNISNVVNSYNISNEKSVHSTRTDVAKQSENVDTLPTSEVHQASQNYPRHVPVHILDGSLGVSAKTTSSPMESMFNQMSGVHGHQNVFMNPAASANSNASRPSVCQSFPSYQPIFTPIQNPDDYHSFLHLSSTFSSLILSALSQNPAAYAAATFASTLWPCVNNMEGPVEPFQSRPTSSTPSMAAIAAATVAAATAWWAAHGLLPVCAPFHPGFTGSPPGDENRNTERRENSPDPEGQQQLEPECSEALRDQQHSDSEASEGAKPNAAVETAKAVDTDDANKSKNKKQVDRSSCGSNTPSSSEVEGDALEKHTEGVEENHHMNDKDELEDPFNRRCRSSSTYTINDSWKEVSEEGRLAFQALFSREVLPQSFSPPHKDMKSCGVATRLQLDLNGMTWVGTSSQKQDNDSASLIVEENKEEEGLLSMGLGQAKLKARRTGFKPYKRCSMEAKESCRVSVNGQDEEKGAKRLRVEGEAST